MAPDSSTAGNSFFMHASCEKPAFAGTLRRVQAPCPEARRVLCPAHRLERTSEVKRMRRMPAAAVQLQIVQFHIVGSKQAQHFLRPFAMRTMISPCADDERRG